MAIRTLVTQLVVQGLDSLKDIEKLKGMLEDLEKVKAKIEISADASGLESSVKSAKDALTGIGAKTKTEMSQVQSSLDSLKSSGANLNAQMGLITGGFGDVSKEMKEVSDASRDSAEEVTTNWKGVEDQIKKVAVATSAISVGTMYMAAAVQDQLEKISYMSGPESLEKVYKPWVLAAGTIKGSSISSRASMAQYASAYLPQVSPEKQIDFMSLLEKESKREGLDADTMQTILQSVGAGRISILNRYLAGTGLDTDKIQAEAKRLAGSASYTRSHPGLSQDQIAANLFIEKFTEWGNKTPIESLGGKTLKEANIDAGEIKDITTSISDLSYTLGQNLVPFLTMFADNLEKINGLLQQNPGAAQFIALSVALIALTSSSVLMLAAMKASMVTLGLLPYATQAATIGITALRAAMLLLWANPPIAILLLLATVLLYVAAKTGVLQKALEVLDNAGGQFLAGLMQDLTNLKDMAAGVWDKLSKLTSGGGGVAGLLLTLAFPPAAMMAFVTNLPQIVKWLGSLFGRTDIMGDIQNEEKSIILDIYRLLQPFINLVMWIYKLLQDFWTWVQKMPEDIAARIEKILPNWVTGATAPTSDLEKQLYDMLKKDTTTSGLSDNIIKALSIYGIGEEPYINKKGEVKPESEVTPEEKKSGEWQVINFNYYTNAAQTELALQLGDKLKAGNIAGPTTSPEWPNNAILSTGTGTGANTKNEPIGVQGYSMSSEWSGGATDQEMFIKNTKGVAEGGRVTRTGPELIHEGEEFSPAEVVKGSETVLERFMNLFDKVSSLKSSGNTVVVHQYYLNGPLIGEAKLDNFSSDKDLDDLLYRMRNKLDELSMRTSGQYRA